MKGIDVSTHNGYPNWKKVAAAGVEFAYVKATQGHAESSGSYLFTDSKFAYNITNAVKNGIACGVYHYLTARNPTEAGREADYFLNAIAKYKEQITLHAAVDVESVHLDGLSRSTLTAVVREFCDRVSSAGYRPLIYTNPNWIKNRLGDISGEPLWLALWRPKSMTPKGYADLTVWQYGQAHVNGISSRTDVNEGYMELPKYTTLSPTTVGTRRNTIKVGDTVRVETPLIYGTNRRFKLYYDEYTVMSINGNRVVVGHGRKVTAAVHIDNVELIQ